MNVNPFSKIQMVDDKANRFLPPSNMSWIYNANLNDDTYKESGLYCIGSGSSNSPGNWGILTVLKPRNDAIIQYYALNNVMYHRDYTGGSWQSWKTFADTSDLIQSLPFTGTSNSSGYFSVTLPSASCKVVGIECSVYCVWYHDPGTKYVYVSLENFAGTKLASEDASGTLFYIN